MDSKKQKPVIGWIVTANPFEGERYYLRILLNHIRGHLSFDHIKTVDGIIAPTFREAATLHGLLNLDILKFFSNETAVFFIDGPGGTGKTFLYKTLLAKIRSEHFIALATASSGVGGLARLLCLSRLIVYDEAPMSRKESIETFDKMLRDINDPELPFGGKIVVFGRDFRQVLPVVRKDTRQEKINASLAASYLWPMMKKITLSENMRARLDLDFSEYLLQVGNGTSPITIEENIKVPSEMLIPYTNDLESLEDLIDAVFGDMNIYSDNLLQMSNRAILTSRNVYVDQINAILIERFPSEIIRYYTFDETIDSSEQSIMEDFLNTLTPNGLPPHELLLKKNCPIMLFRNIDPSKGLCNGTRLICRNFNRNVIDAKIAIGHYSGKRVFIPRILFLPNADENNGFSFNRTQLPIRLSFAMTINKLQGQILDFVGIYLSQPVFCHGQLYVALSRAKSSSSIKKATQKILFMEIY
ncbi:hypothetical protein CIPAW_08G161000 [Carya illinoinensis]|uniref:ATP-dependent DNA helicase n=1 Tax=Carya illinoinensis TaxID=32201 RepID=A0A8T1PUP2_CARIL|nr:hypothetical protein CIPAW_08G161000 [Carya illinoinensis]